MSNFDKNCLVIAYWQPDGSDRRKYAVINKSATAKITRQLLLKGYYVAWSTALIETMRLPREMKVSRETAP